MRLIILILFSSVFSLAQAQIEQKAESPRASVAIQFTTNKLGIFSEYYLKPNSSVWVSLSANSWGRQLGFGDDSTGVFPLPEEYVTYQKAQRRLVVRSGFRFYENLRNSRFYLWYSPFVGYNETRNISSDYTAGIEREDLNTVFSDYTVHGENTLLELGGEVGARWMFWRKLYVEGMVQAIGQRSLKHGDNNVVLNLGLAIGITF